MICVKRTPGEEVILAETSRISVHPKSNQTDQLSEEFRGKKAMMYLERNAQNAWKSSYTIPLSNRRQYLAREI